MPDSYKALIRNRNGGELLKNSFRNPLQRSWSVGIFDVQSIYGIDKEKPNSLCGKFSTEFWTTEWGYPNIGIAICDTLSGGHDMIFLDYSDCGNDGEPCVVHISQENNYEITYLADNFEEFIKGLFEMDDE